jgi:hypothetical protein
MLCSALLVLYVLYSNPLWSTLCHMLYSALLFLLTHYTSSRFAGISAVERPAPAARSAAKLSTIFDAPINGLDKAVQINIVPFSQMAQQLKLQLETAQAQIKGIEALIGQLVPPPRSTNLSSTAKPSTNSSSTSASSTSGAASQETSSTTPGGSSSSGNTTTNGTTTGTGDATASSSSNTTTGSSSSSGSNSMTTSSNGAATANTSTTTVPPKPLTAAQQAAAAREQARAAAQAAAEARAAALADGEGAPGAGFLQAVNSTMKVVNMLRDVEKSVREVSASGNADLGDRIVVAVQTLLSQIGSVLPR